MKVLGVTVCALELRNLILYQSNKQFAAIVLQLHNNMILRNLGSGVFEFGSQAREVGSAFLSTPFGSPPIL